MGMDDEMGPPPPRRGNAAPTRGPSGGYGEPRGSGNGPARPSYPSAGPSHIDGEREEDDIPF